MKNKRMYLGFGSALVAAGACLVLFWQYSKSPNYQAFGEIVPRVDAAQRFVALTFDDGPTPGATERILAELRDQRVRATFFLTGAELERNPAEGRKIADAGHEIGNHSYSHTRMLFVTPSFVRDEIEATDRLIRAAGFQGPIHFRPPYGKKLFVLPYYLSKTNRKTITWDVDPDSYAEVAESPEKIAEYVARKVRPGSIIVLHVMYKSRETSLGAVGKIITELRGQGYDFKTVSELLAAAENN